MSAIEIITTSDGSHSLLNTALDETYHSRHGALRESNHVFIKNGLDFFLEQYPQRTLSILEVGFGTGLNAWLTLQQAHVKSLHVSYTSLETLPLSEAVWTKLNYAASAEEQLAFEKIHKAPWSEMFPVTDYFSLNKTEVSLQAFTPTDYFDIIYFDAFAPNKQPELWELALLKKVVDALTPHGVFVTYCAKGQLKRDLKSLNLFVETLAGPPGKREMIRATKEKIPNGS